MSVVCPAPDSSGGVALLLSDYLDCQARALGENGFQALAGGALGTSLLTGLLTIFVGLIGYRFILGDPPGVRDGVGWTVRVGLVLALMTSWPAFQTLVYDVAVEGPREMAATLLPASGLPSEDIAGRVQRAYDTIRLGSADPEAASAERAAAEASDPEGEGARLAQRYQFQPALPRTASLFVISTSGFEGALRVGVGFLLAVAPLAILALLFDATLGFFSGWVRAVGGMTLASLGATITTALGLVAVEGELARVQAFRASGSLAAIDTQALSVLVILFAIVTLVTVLAALRMTSAFRLPRARARTAIETERLREALPLPLPHLQAVETERDAAAAGRSAVAMQSRVSSVVESLSSSVRREALQAAAAGGGGGGPRGYGPAVPGAGAEIEAVPRGAARRGLGRRTRRGARRDGSS